MIRELFFVSSRFVWFELKPTEYFLSHFPYSSFQPLTCNWMRDYQSLQLNFINRTSAIKRQYFFDHFVWIFSLASEQIGCRKTAEKRSTREDTKNQCTFVVVVVAQADEVKEGKNNNEFKYLPCLQVWTSNEPATEAIETWTRSRKRMKWNFKMRSKVGGAS